MSKMYDFAGWATKSNVLCSDGRIIGKNAFCENDGKKVPLVWNHNHKDAEQVLGHVILQHRDEGVYAYGTFNNTSKAKLAKESVQHGDIVSMSICANGLTHDGNIVTHGNIREVSLVLAGANPEAYIETVLMHSDDGQLSETGDSIIFMNSELELSHNDKEDEKGEDTMSKEKTVGDVFNTLNDEQKEAVYAIIGSIIEENENEDETEEGDKEMKHNVFENENGNEEILTHSMEKDIINDAKRLGSFKESALQHGVTNIDYLMPDYKNVTQEPGFVSRDMSWVTKVMNSVHRTPFARIRTLQADIREDEARAKGFIKGKQKKEEVFTMLKRTTDPQTIYKKQNISRDDYVDITDFNVVAWIKKEMRMMLDEEIARSILIGDGRLSDAEDKIQESHIRPVWSDADLYTIKKQLAFPSTSKPEEKASTFIKESIRARKEYRGSGMPTLFCSEDVLTECLLLEDTTGRTLYDSVDKLATKLRVKEIITVPVMDKAKRTVSEIDWHLMGIFVNLDDYNIGADKGGAVSLFDDFDIDTNGMKYLIETRCSGALTKPLSAIAVEYKVEG